MDKTFRTGLWILPFFALACVALWRQGRPDRVIVVERGGVLEGDQGGALAIQAPGRPEALEFKGRRYDARVDADGLTFDSEGVTLRSRAIRVEQGAFTLDCPAGTAGSPRADVAQIDRQWMVEEYVFEKDRVEQLFRFDRPLGEGALRITVAMETGLVGPLPAGPWRRSDQRGDGLWFRDPEGRRILRYYGAKAIDAEGTEMALALRGEPGRIVVEVPHEYMARAKFPLTVDPWIQLDGSASGTGISGPNAMQSSVAVGPSGSPVVAWSDENEVFVSRWDPATQAWTGFAGSHTGGISASPIFTSVEPSLALDAAGYPVVAWTEAVAAFTKRIYLKRWNPAGGNWVQLGGSATGDGVSGAVNSMSPSLALDSSGNPVVAWTAGAADPEIYLKRWDSGSTTWVELGNSATGGGISATAADYSSGPSLALTAAGDPYVAWTETIGTTNHVFLRFWNSGWQELAGSGTTGLSEVNVPAGAPSLALDPSGKPVVSWTNGFPGQMEVFVKRWTDLASWESVGASTSINGISSSNGSAFGSRLVVDANGNPVVVWSSSISGDSCVYLRRWNPSTAFWEELFGSATGRGLSLSPGDTDSPSLALDSSGNPVVAWTQFNAGERHVLLAQYSPASFVALAQARMDGSTLTAGAVSAHPAVMFRGTPNSFVGLGRMQIEVKPIGVAFQNVPDAESPLVAGATSVSISLPLGNGSYHWQARFMDQSGHDAAWMSFGANPEADADFIVDFSATVTVVNNTTKKCGLLGIELLLVLALRRLRRR